MLSPIHFTRFGFSWPYNIENCRRRNWRTSSHITSFEFPAYTLYSNRTVVYFIIHLPRWWPTSGLTAVGSLSLAIQNLEPVCVRMRPTKEMRMDAQNRTISSTCPPGCLPAQCPPLAGWLTWSPSPAIDCSSSSGI